MRIFFLTLLIIAILTCSIHCQGGGGGDGDSTIGNILSLRADILEFVVRGNRSDNNTVKVVKSSHKNNTYMVPSNKILFLLCIVVLAMIWISWRDTVQPSNETFVNEVDKTSSEFKIEDLDNLFRSGHWASHYFQYKRWHGPHTVLLFFDHQKLKVTGSGTDDVGEFSIDGTYSFKTRRIGLTKNYQKGTGNPSENLEHTVTIQLAWNLKERELDGNWYVETKNYNGKDKFKLKFDQPRTVFDDLEKLENC